MSTHHSNTQRPTAKMLSESKYSDMKGRIPRVKELFQTRHYIQCATLCDLLLTRTNDEIHPVHRAYLNFYLAISHDTMAREATYKNRSAELDLAEKHYVAAIAALTPAEPQKLEDIQESSPTSVTSDDEANETRRRTSNASSLNSEHSTASSATSLEDTDAYAPDCEPTPKISNHFRYSQPSRNFVDEVGRSTKLVKKRPSPIITSRPKSTQLFHLDQFSSDLSSFVSMVQMHLNGVRDLKENTPAPSVRFSFSRPRNSTVSSRPISRDSSTYSDTEMEKLRWSRRSMNFRPRFDPTSVRTLCEEAIAEL